VTVPECDPARLGDYRWTVDGKVTVARVLSRKACLVEIDVRALGRHRITASAPEGGKASQLDMVARDFLVVGLGDSIASGEGNPDISKADDGPAWQEARCDRSARSFQALAALAVEKRDRKASVSFVHLACSGAAIASGVTASYWGIAPGDANLPLESQIGSLAKAIGKRPIDAAIISIGANDVGFGAVLVFCVKWTHCQDKTYENGKTLRQVVDERLARLPDAYAELAMRLRPFVAADRVYLNQYPDQLRDARGEICDTILEGSVTGVRADEAGWMYERFFVPLNAAVARAAATHGWNLITGAPAAFRNHGYCAGASSWVRTYDQSFATQGDRNGTMHPNQAGHERMGELAAKLLLRDLYPGGKPRP
jgi:lysophospholipase L1-like esterase